MDDFAYIESHIIDFYSSLFSSSRPSSDLSGIKDMILPMVSDEQNNFLCSIPSNDEIKAVVFAMDAQSAPGPDGFSGLFYTQCWSIMGKEVCDAVHSFFVSGFIMPGFNSNLMVLIPKTKDADSIDKFRPIILVILFSKASLKF